MKRFRFLIVLFAFLFTDYILPVVTCGFSGSTLVETGRGLQSLESIYEQFDQQCFSISGYSNQIISNVSFLIYQPLTAINRNIAWASIFIEFNDDPNKTVICGLPQKFFIYEVDTWLSASKLRKGDHVYCKDGTFNKITQHKILLGPQMIYMLAFESGHIFFVTDLGLVAH